MQHIHRLDQVPAMALSTLSMTLHEKINHNALNDNRIIAESDKARKKYSSFSDFFDQISMRVGGFLFHFF